MNPDAARADRNASIRATARAWHKAGAIDEAALAAAEAAYPDDRQRVGPVFRVLLFVFSLIAIGGASGFVWALIGNPSDATVAVLSLILGILLLVATEIQIHPMRRAQSGVEAATSLAGFGFAMAFVAWAVDQIRTASDAGFAGALLTAALLLAGMAWRWGYPLYAGVAMAAFLGIFLVIPGTRLAWIVLPAVLAPILVRGSELERLPPSLRVSCTAVLGVSLAGLYVAVNYASYDRLWLEGLKQGTLPGSPAWRTLVGIATALVPVAYLAIGVRTRRYVFLLLGAGTAAASAVTLRAYVHLAPLWVILTLSGMALAGAVFALRRFLDSGVGKERGGFTAEPLFEDLARRRMLEAGATVLSLSPEVRPVHQEPKLEGGGGAFGGGGSSSEF